MNKTKLMIRIAAGAYLLYSAYSIGKGFLNHETDSIPIAVFAVLFLLVGAYFMVSGIRDLKKANALEQEEAARDEELTREKESFQAEEKTAKPKSIAERARMKAKLSDEQSEEE